MKYIQKSKKEVEVFCFYEGIPEWVLKAIKSGKITFTPDKFELENMDVVKKAYDYTDVVVRYADGKIDAIRRVDFFDEYEELKADDKQER